MDEVLFFNHESDYLEYTAPADIFDDVKYEPEYRDTIDIASKYAPAFYDAD